MLRDTPEAVERGKRFIDEKRIYFPLKEIAENFILKLFVAGDKKLRQLLPVDILTYIYAVKKYCLINNN